MSLPAADPTTSTSEATGLVAAQTYAPAVTRAYTDIAEQTARFAARLGVHGPAVAAVTRALTCPVPARGALGVWELPPKPAVALAACAR